MKLQLPNVTCLIIDCLNAERSIKVLEHCKSKVDFGAVKFLTSIPCQYEHRVEIMPLNSLIAYSIFVLTRLHEYIETDFVQIVQRDGWILNPESWDNRWLEKYQYIGPLFMQYPVCGSGGFSLRSKGLMEFTAETTPRWDGTEHHAQEIQRKSLNYYEDGIISFGKARTKFNIASPEDAAMYAQGGNRDPKYFRNKSYGFHRTFQCIDFKTGEIDSSDLTADIKAGYDEIIDTL